MHLSGAVYAENIIRYGAESRDCVDLFTFVASPRRACADNDLSVTR
jgi:hypothetical protein